MRGLSMAEALARALLAEAQGASEAVIAASILDPAAHAPNVATLLSHLRTLTAASEPDVS
jgi:hypothetical protein